MPPPRLDYRASAPGRICLFGEHQDYLGLPVIPAAISLRITITARHADTNAVRLDLPDIRDAESFPLTPPLPYARNRDYFRSSVNVLARYGFTFNRGLTGTVRGDIPINAGTASSSALVTAWTGLLARMSGQEATPPPERLASLAHEAEVLEFGEPGGMMDHLAAAHGGILWVTFSPSLAIEPLAVRPGAFVLGDSGEPKDTVGILSRVKNRVLDIVRTLKARHPDFSLMTIREEHLDAFSRDLDDHQFTLLRGTVRNHALTLEARRVLTTEPLQRERLGSLLSEHQSVLRETLKISTPKIDRMLDAGMNAGALGGKINGSGGGGCMFAYAPTGARRVAEAIERAGGRAWVVGVGEGVQVSIISG